MRSTRIAAALLAAAAPLPAYATITFTDSYDIAGNATDLSGQSATFGGNRLSLGSDLFYNAADGLYYGITDRGPGGGLLPFIPRVNKFSLDVNDAGEITGFNLVDTILFRRADGTGLNGLNPTLLSGSPAVLGNSFDPEGFAILPNGNFLVSDEYGPSVYEFGPNGLQTRSYTPPSNIVPREADGDLNFTDGRPTITTGRQDNRGFEGLTISNDGTKAYAVLQDPLVNEGPQGDGRRGRNLRIVEYSTATGESTAQYVYQLDSLADINPEVPGDEFGPTAQGRNIGLSSITALPDGTFLVIERDNRGIGIDDPTGARPIGIKRVYRIDLAGATDVTNEDLTTLSNDIVPVSKSLFLDIKDAIGADPVEKLEGLTFGPQLDDGSFMMFIVSDNDFSVTQTGEGLQFDVCTPGEGGDPADVVQLPIGGACPTGTGLLPTRIYAFRVTADEITAPVVPEPASWAMMIAGFGLIGAALRRRTTVAFA